MSISPKVNSRFMNCRPKKGEPYIPTALEHKANIISHGVWILPSLIGLYKLIHTSPTSIHLWIGWIYGLCMCLVFATSTAFHIISFAGNPGGLKTCLHLGDRAVIYVFIAASYTPWMVLKEHSIGLEIVWYTWLAAVLGVVYQFSFYEKYKWLEIVLYLTMGICPSIFVLGLDDHCGVIETAIGGLIYIIGVIFFKCDGIIPFAHAIWHCFVTLAASCHFYAVLTHLYLNNVGVGPRGTPTLDLVSEI